MDRLLNVISLLSLGLMIWVLASVRRAHIRVEYSVSWLLACALLFLLSRWRAADELLARWLGAEDAASALLLVTGAVFLIVLYRQSLRISGLKDSNIKLAQRVAILEYRMTNGEGPRR